MAEAISNNNDKKLIQIDVSSDTIRGHPYILDDNAPKEGVPKKVFYEKKIGAQVPQMFARLTGVFKDLGLEYDTTGLTGGIRDGYRLIYFAGQQGNDNQHNIVDEMGVGYFTEGKFIGDREFLLECARKVGVEGAAEFLNDPNNGLKEVNKEFEEYFKGITGVPYYVINGKVKLSDGQPQTFVRAFQTATDGGA